MIIKNLSYRVERIFLVMLGDHMNHWPSLKIAASRIILQKFNHQSLHTNL